jgi:DNA polymerase-3 subunit alpha
LLAEQQADAAGAVLDRLEALFPGRLYFELSRRGDSIEERAEAALIDLAYARGLPLVATNPACFTDTAFHRAHDAMLCIAQSSQLDRDDRVKSSSEAWIKPAADMRRLFADLPEAIENTALIARRCAFGAPKRKPILPSIAGDLEGEADQLRRDARAGLRARLQTYPLVPSEVEGRGSEAVQRPSTALGTSDALEEQYRAYFERLDFECDVIIGWASRAIS